MKRILIHVPHGILAGLLFMAGQGVWAATWSGAFIAYEAFQDWNHKTSKSCKDIYGFAAGLALVSVAYLALCVISLGYRIPGGLQ